MSQRATIEVTVTFTYPVDRAKAFAMYEVDPTSDRWAEDCAAVDERYADENPDELRELLNAPGVSTPTVTTRVLPDGEQL